jgi:hypothetical protein
MGMITHLLNQTARIILTAKNEWGDQKYVSEQSVPCRFRYITQIQGAGHSEELGSPSANMWFEQDAPVQEGTICIVEDRYWRVNRIIKARNMENSDIKFIKCEVSPHYIAEIS